MNKYFSIRYLLAQIRTRKQKHNEEHLTARGIATSDGMLVHPQVDQQEEAERSGILYRVEVKGDSKLLLKEFMNYQRNDIREHAYVFVFDGVVQPKNELEQQ